MKKIVLIALAVILAFSVLACGKPAEEPTPEPTQLTTSSEEPEEAPVEEASEAPVGTPENISPTTGLENTTTTYKPVIVQIGNESHERPQVGLQKADVVYETPIEGADTRFTALYNDALWTGDPQALEVGPVRSSRYYHQWIQGEWDALYVHVGGPDATGNPESDIWKVSNEHIKQRINGAGKHAVNTQFFYPLYDGKKQDDYAGIDLIKAVSIYNYEPKQVQQFTFYPLESYADAKEIKKIALPFFNGENWVEYYYDQSTDKLTRYMKGDEHVDRATGEPLTVQNLIIEFTTVADMPNDAGHRQVDVIGKGPAEFVIHGKHLTGTWSRPSGDDKTTYTLDNGEELVLTPGNTWIEIYPNTKPVVTTYADGTEGSSQD